MAPPNPMYLPEMVWIDVETIGLNQEYDPMIELGLIVTDRFGNERARFQRVIGSHIAIDRLEANEIADGVREMHTKNGLFDEVRSMIQANGYHRAFADSKDRDAAEYEALQFLFENFGKDSHGTIPMAGASVQFDRGVLFQQMYGLHKWFHYRQYDVSTILSLAQMAEIEPDRTVKKRDLHRSVPDCIDEISVHRWAMSMLREYKEVVNP